MCILFKHRDLRVNLSFFRLDFVAVFVLISIKSVVVKHPANFTGLEWARKKDGQHTLFNGPPRLITHNVSSARFSFGFIVRVFGMYICKQNMDVFFVLFDGFYN